MIKIANKYKKSGAVVIILATLLALFSPFLRTTEAAEADQIIKNLEIVQKSNEYYPGESIYIKGDWSIPDDTPGNQYKAGDTFSMTIPEGLNAGFSSIDMGGLATGKIVGNELVFTFTNEIEGRVNRKGGFQLRFEVKTPAEEGISEVNIGSKDENGNTLIVDKIIVNKAEQGEVGPVDEPFGKSKMSQTMDGLMWYVRINHNNSITGDQVKFEDQLGPDHILKEDTIVVQQHITGPSDATDITDQLDIVIDSDKKGFTIPNLEIGNAPGGHKHYTIYYETQYTGNETEGKVQLENTAKVISEDQGVLYPDHAGDTGIVEGEFDLGVAGWGQGDKCVKFKMKKVDSVTKEPLAEAKFKLSHKIDENFTPIEFTTDENGEYLHDYPYINNGLYVLEELEAPEGYQKMPPQDVRILWDPQGGGNQVFEFEIENTLKPINIKGQKEWFDEHNKPIASQEDIAVSLFANGEKVRQQILPKGETEFEFKNLPQKDEDGKIIAYTVEEIETEGYTSSIAGNAALGFIITNTKEPTPEEPTLGQATLEVTKKLTGRDLVAGEFEFELFEEGNTKAIQTQTNALDGKVMFDALEFTKEGTYKYTILEVNDGKPGVTYDESVINVTVTVEDKDGALVAVAAYDPEATFSNSYATTEGSLVLEGTKELIGRTLSDQEFNFVVVDESGEELAKGTNDATGKINFTEIKYTEPGKHNYTVKEVAGTEPGMTYDTTEFTVNVEVKDVDSKLVATATYPTPITFKNTYKPTDGTVTFEVNKTLTGRDLIDGEFSFELLNSNGDIVHEITNVGGKITFPAITLSNTGDFTYTIREKAGTDAEIKYDTSEITATFSVTDEGGELVAGPVTYMNGTEVDNTFDNFTETEPSITKKINETLDYLEIGHEAPYNYDIKTPVPADIHQYKHFVIHDTVDARINVTGAAMMTNREAFEVVTTENGDGTTTVVATLKDFAAVEGVKEFHLQINANIKANQPSENIPNKADLTWTNTAGTEGVKETPEVTVIPPFTEIPVTKLWSDNTPKDKKTEVTVNLLANGQDAKTMLSAEEYNDVVTSINLNEDNNWTGKFTNLPEKDNQDQPIDYTVEEVEVTGFTSNVLGSDESGFSIMNTYAPEDGTVTLAVAKILSGRDMESGEFTFELVNSNGEVIGTTTNPAAEDGSSGSVTFKPITLTSTGTFTYTLREVTGTDETIIYDEAPITATIVVEEIDGKFVATDITYDSDAKFDNKVKPEETTVAPEEITTTVEPEETTVIETTVAETTEVPVETTEETTVVPVPLDGDVTLRKIETPKDGQAIKYLDYAIFDLIQTSKYITFELIDQTESKLFKSLAVDVLKDGQLVKDNLSIQANVTELVDLEVTEEGSYSLAFDNVEGVEFTYEINADGTGFVVYVTDVEEESTVEKTQATSAEAVADNSQLDAQISELQARIEMMNANVPVPVEQTELVPGEVIEIAPESTDEMGNVTPAQTTVEMVSQPVGNNQAEIDAHMAQITELQTQLETLQAQAAETTQASTTVETTQAEDSEDASQETVKEMPKLIIKLNEVIFDDKVTKGGSIIATKLSKGQYYFIEVEAPKGYITDKETKYAFEITGKETKTIELIAENEPVKEESSEETTTVEPVDDSDSSEESTTKPGGGRTGGELPSTGETTNYFVLSGLALIAGSTFLVSKNRKSNKS